jgi:hypothetical protein
MTDLRAELERIAERAPTVEVPSDLYARARRTNARHRVLCLAAVTACLLLLAGLVGTRPWVGTIDRGPTPATSHAAPRMPDRIWAVPEWLTARRNDDSWSRKQVSDDVAVGTAAAVYTRDGLPVVISAYDGSYHLLDLPDYVGNRWAVSVGLYSDAIDPALSPDGSHLAYSYVRFGSGSEAGTTSTGIRDLDLTDGSIREIPLRGGAGVIVTRIRWSPSGTWLAWSGVALKSWMAIGSMTSGPPISGVVAPGASQSDALPPLDANDLRSDLAVDDAGRVALSLRGRLELTGPRGAGPRTPIGDERRAERVSLHLDESGPTVLTDDQARGPVLSPAGARARVIGGGGSTRLLGRAGERWLVLDGESAVDDPLVIGEVQPDGVGVAVWIAPGIQRVSVATDLLSSPPVARPAPDWPWSPDRWGYTLAGAGIGLLAAIAIGLAWLRSRRKLSR